MLLRVPYCPSCGARLAPPPGASRVTCEYCAGTVLIEAEQVRHLVQRRREAKADPEVSEDYLPPDSRLFQHRTERFELSVLEQVIPEAGREAFAPVPLEGGRFAIYYLRLVDDKGRSLPDDPAAACERLTSSLEEDGDPGLAACNALELLAEGGYCNRVEAAITLFDPERASVLAYNAGCQDSLWWVSQEEGRCVSFSSPHPPLERRMLREARDYFSNSSKVYLSAGDLLLQVSSGYAGRGGGPYASGIHGLTQTLNQHIGEHPLRVVTLAKNAFWASRAPASRKDPPAGHIRVAAVRAVPPDLAEALPPLGQVECFRSRSFETALWRRPGDVVLDLPLHAERRVLLWISPVRGQLEGPQVDALRDSVLAVLDRRDHGDNENPRQAGRNGLEALGPDAPEVRLAVIQLFDEYRRVKYFRWGWKQPLALGARGVQPSDGMQQFDEGGEATVREGSRLFFPGDLDYRGQVANAADLASLWRGGKASRLYEALASHWRTRRTDRALEALVRAIASDRPEHPPAGLALVTGLPS